MQESKKDYVSSKVVGLVYTDIVVYILPGFFLISGIALVFGFSSEIGAWISKVNFSGTIVFALIVPAVSFLTGIFISFFRWNLYPYRPYKGKLGILLYEDESIPENIKKNVRDRILKDLDHLKVLSPKFKNSSNKNEVPEKIEMIQLFDFFWGLMIDALRESGLQLYAVYDRHDDICNLLENIVISIQFLSFIAAIKFILIYSNFLGILITIAIIGLTNILMVYLYIRVLPRTRYKFMSQVLFSYLNGNLKIKN